MSLLEKESLPIGTFPKAITPKVPTMSKPHFGGLDIGTIGTIASTLGSLWTANKEQDYKNSLLQREDKRIARDRKRQERFEANMRKAYQ